jgi:hypothetical protein
MASNQSSDMNTCTVSGKVFDAVTRQGLVKLLATVYHLAKIEQGNGFTLEKLLSNAIRMGSVPLDSQGAFTFSYTASDLHALGDGIKRLNLLLVISAAEDDSTGSAGKTVYFSNPPRWNAGRNESFNIGISRKQQQKFSLLESLPVSEHLDSYTRSRKDEKILNDGIVAFHKTAIDQDIKQKQVLRERLLSAIATKVDVAKFPGVVVGPNDSINTSIGVVGSRAVTSANTQINQTQNNKQGVEVNLYLTPADRERLQPFFDNAVDGFANIPEHALQDILFRTNSTDNPGTLLINQNPIAAFCSESSHDEICAKQHTGLMAGTDEHDHDESGTPATPPASEPEIISNANLPRYITNLLGQTPSPDLVLTPAFNGQRADKDAIAASINQFSLIKGPADVPAFYDFHSLQIAFDHVWKILVDEDVVNTAHALDKKYTAKTGRSLSVQFPNNWTTHLSSVMIYEAIPQEVPADVASQFDINIEEWTDLSASHQQKLREITAQIIRISAPFTTTNTSSGSFWGNLGNLGNLLHTTRRMTASDEKVRQDFREQGERLIDAVRHDDYFTMHKTLRDLQERINGNYEFTVFAADRNSHSVNFGLLNTYRQQWTPLNYQAGQLVKTIPLSPKEERKYSLKTTRTLKRVEKEARKNNSTTNNEQTSTSRVEADIMEKAQNKTNFGINAEGSYNIGISKGKSTTTFGVEAQQESAGNRKDFREAVLKAVQEYKEERNVEIDTEDSLTSEYSESGTIVNPNDELSVTYLFYELQRRYRISEQLYRAMPVVMVAQEVPAPHQISEAWVISNDWIINRALLDDSFRPALQYLANKSVGDDFALRELRKNLRQQRNVVESLRIELALASNEADNRYRALENAIEKRITEESSENTDGFFSDVGDFFGGGGQDPEAAKARELAAKDAQQHAIEKAEKAAAALRQEVNSLHSLTTEYNNTLRNHLDNETRVKRLLVHIRNNIFHYMQAIWNMEPPDQRFLRLHKVQVPQIELARIADPAHAGATLPNKQYRVEVLASDDIFQSFREPGTTKHHAFMTGVMQPITEFKSLVEVADLDTMLGFKGNYMIFGLKQHNALTEFMAAPFVDSAFGAMDPDELSNVSLGDYSKYVCCLHEKMTDTEFDAIKAQLKKWLELLLADPVRNGDEIVVPTNSLFIEALPGTHPLLENFKLRHRELDVYKVQADVRKAELENLRLAARLLNSEREDPDIDKKISIEGGAAVVVGPDL